MKIYKLIILNTNLYEDLALQKLVESFQDLRICKICVLFQSNIRFAFL